MKNDKRWITINTYVDVDTGEILGTKKPNNYTKSIIINKEYEENETNRIIIRTIGIKKCGEQLKLFN